jgi:hypothetical protein
MCLELEVPTYDGILSLFKPFLVGFPSFVVKRAVTSPKSLFLLPSHGSWAGGSSTACPVSGLKCQTHVGWKNETSCGPDPLCPGPAELTLLMCVLSVANTNLSQQPCDNSDSLKSTTS